MKCTISITLSTLLLLTTVTSCRKDKDSKLARATDEALFNQIRYACEISNGIWPGYEFSTYPLYLIYKESENSPPVRGFLINPPASDLPPGATPVPGWSVQGINVYRFDDSLIAAKNLLQQGNMVYDPLFKIKNTEYYTQIYNSSAGISSGTNTLKWIIIAFHENFHNYQFSDWQPVPDGLQDGSGYPVNNQLLPLQLMTMEIAKKMPAETSISVINKYLAMYVSIRSKEMELDPTMEKYVLHMANFQEFIEGPARYVEFSLGKGLFGTDYHTSYEPSVSTSLSSRDEMRDFFTWGIWYGTGASVIYMLERKGVDVKNQLKAGKTPYQIASEALNLTNNQKASFLQQAKDEFHWSTTIAQEATRLLAL